MRQKKDKIIIVALSSLILFSSSLALMMYLKKDKVVNIKEEQVVVYVSKAEIQKGMLVKNEDMQKKLFPKSAVSFSPLMPEEIIGKYAKVDFLVGEPYRTEKLTLKKGVDQVKKQNDVVISSEEKSMSISNDSVSLSLNLFKNSDYSLKSGDFIDIVSVKEEKNRDKNAFSTTYVALHVKILSFSKDGVTQSSYQKYIVTKDKKEKVVADSIVLDMPPEDIKNLLIAYYSTQEFNAKRVYSSKNNIGHLWMIKTKDVIDNKAQMMKQDLMLDKKVVHKKVITKRKASPKVLITYEKE